MDKHFKRFKDDLLKNSEELALEYAYEEMLELYISEATMALLIEELSYEEEKRRKEFDKIIDSGSWVDMDSYANKRRKEENNDKN